ncbi:hypothetical protein AOLI_G00315570 [Acnodon oligacanthus]
MALAAVSLCLLVFASTHLRPSHGNNRHAVYWNSSNIQLQVAEAPTEASRHEYRSRISPVRFEAPGQKLVRNQNWPSSVAVEPQSPNQVTTSRMSEGPRAGAEGQGACRARRWVRPSFAPPLGSVLSPDGSAEAPSCER